MMMRRMTAPDKPKGSRWALLGRAAALFRPYRAALTLMIALLAASSAMQLVSVRVMGAMVDEMVGGTADALNWLVVIAAGLVLGSALIGVAQSYINQVIGQGVMLRLRSDLHSHLQRLPVRFFTQTRTGEILSRVSTDVNAVQQAVTGTFTEFLQAALTLVIAFALMFHLRWELALATLMVLPLWVYPTKRVGERMRGLMREWHEESARMSSQLEETLSVSGSMLVKTFGRENHERARFEESNESLRSLAVRRMMAGRWFNMATTGFGALIPGIVYWYGGRAVLGGDAISPGEVVAFAMLTQQVFGPFATIARVNTTMLSSAALFERIFEYLDLPVEVDERLDALVLTGARGQVTFEDVRFAYAEGGRAALDGVSLAVEPGEMVALVGPSGAGKTTVTYLLQRFYDPQQGAVRIDGHDLRDLSLASVSDAVGAVMQETYLFHASLADNIRYGRRPRGRPRRARRTAPRRPRYGGGRAWLPALRRREAARGDCARDPQGPAGTGAGRGDIVAGLATRTRDPGGEGGAGARTHDDRDRAPALHRRRRRPDPRVRRRPHRRAGPARRTAGTRGVVRLALPRAICAAGQSGSPRRRAIPLALR